MPKAREVRKAEGGGSREALTGLRKCKPPSMARSSRGAQPLSGATNCQWGRNEVFERSTGPARCQRQARRWDFH